MITLGNKIGEAIIRRIDHGPDVRDMLHQTLEAAAIEAGAQWTVEDSVIYPIRADSD